jgi:hypothetical protein
MFMCVSVQHTVQCALPPGHLNYKYMALCESKGGKPKGGRDIGVEIYACVCECALTSYPLKSKVKDDLSFSLRIFSMSSSFQFRRSCVNSGTCYPKSHKWGT